MKRCLEFMTEAAISAPGGVFVLSVIGLAVLVSDVNAPNVHDQQKATSSYLERGAI